MHRVFLNSPPRPEPDDVFEEDCGLMDGDDGGYTSFAQLCHDEHFSCNSSSGTYSLLVPFEPPNPLLHSDSLNPVAQHILNLTTGILSSSGNQSSAVLSPSHLNGKSDLGSNSHSEQHGLERQNNNASRLPQLELAPSQNILQILGESNSVVRTVKAVQAIRHIRQEIFAILTSKSLISKPITVKPEPLIATDTQNVKEYMHGNNEKNSGNVHHGNLRQAQEDSIHQVRDHHSAGILDICNSLNETQSNPVETNCSGQHTSTLRAVCALMLMYSGFSDCSEIALDIFVDLLIHFIRNIGRSLVIKGEEGETGLVPLSEQLQLIGESGFRGGLADLLSFLKVDLVRTEQAAIDVKSNLESQMHALKRVSSKGRENSAQKGSVGDPMQIEEGKVKQEQVANDPPENNNSDSQPVDCENVDFDNEAFSFGYLNKKIRLDMLGGIQVPPALAYKGQDE